MSQCDDDAHGRLPPIARRVQEARKRDSTTHVEEAGVKRTDLYSIVGKYWLKRPFLSKIRLGNEEGKT